MNELRQVDLLRKIAGGFIHKIRNPLGIMSVSTQFCIKYPKKKDKVKNHLENIYRCINNIEKTLEYLDAFCRPLQLGMSRIAANKMLDGLFYLVQDKCKHQEIKLTERYRHVSQELSADRDYLSEALLNIILNAIEAMPGGGVLTLEAGIDNKLENVIIKFTDTGSGILERHKDGIFDPFFTTKEDRIGLGLCIAQRIINAHNGVIEVESAVGKGTTVTVCLPITKAPKE